jgi:hypothetical protein
VAAPLVRAEPALPARQLAARLAAAARQLVARAARHRPAALPAKAALRAALARVLAAVARVARVAKVAPWAALVANRRVQSLVLAAPAEQNGLGNLASPNLPSVEAMPTSLTAPSASRFLSL